MLMPEVTAFFNSSVRNAGQARVAVAGNDKPPLSLISEEGKYGN
jgi:hypothetical protein